MILELHESITSNILNFLELEVWVKLLFTCKFFSTFMKDYLPLDYTLDKNWERFQLQYRSNLMQYYLRPNVKVITFTGDHIDDLWKQLYKTNEKIREVLLLEQKLIDLEYRRLELITQLGDKSQFYLERVHYLSLRPESDATYELKYKYIGSNGVCEDRIQEWSFPIIDKFFRDSNLPFPEIRESTDPRGNIHDEWIEELIKWDASMCYTSLPCRHTATVKCTDGVIRNTRYMYAPEIINHLKKQNEPIPEHFDYMKKYPDRFGYLFSE